MRRFLFISLLFPVLGLAAQSDSIRHHVRHEYRSVPADSQTIWWVSTIRPDGTWADIDYQDRSLALWQLEKHLDRLVNMALYYESSEVRSPKDLEKIVKGLRHWFVGDYHNDNWWYEKIGVPRRILTLAYVLDDDLPVTLRDTVSRALDAIDSDGHPARPGGDRIQVLSNHAKVLLWRRDIKGAVLLFKKIEAEASVAPMEDVMYDAAGGLAVRNAFRPAGRGLQADLTFHHRGDRVNSTVTYGLELPEYFTYWAQLLSDTPWHFSTCHIHMVIDFYLDGVCRHLVRGRYVEPSAFNRELARPWSGTMSSRLSHQLMAVCGGYRVAELHHMADVQEGKADFTASYAHHFWQSEYFVFSRPHYQTAVRLHSVRNANQEAAHNQEGLRNHFRGDGACHLSVTGTEYRGLQPVFDFRRIPGVTSPLLPYEPLAEWGSVNMLTSEIVFAGAVCDSLYGAVAFDFKSERSDLQARKSWFFFDQGYVCLGSDISYHSTADTLVTTVEQCRQQSPLRRHGQWYFHGGNGYQVIDGHAESTIQQRHGRWDNCVRGVTYTADTLSASVFTLSIDHGVKPHGSHYAYAVVPGVTRAVKPWYTILRNGRGIQAVESRDGETVYVVFYQAGSIRTHAGRIRVDAPCMVMVRQGEIYVSDPSRQSATLTLTVDGMMRQISLPMKENGGRTIKVGQL